MKRFPHDLPAISGLILRACLATYPRSFRQRYSAAIAQTFHDQTSAARRRGVAFLIFVMSAELWNIVKHGLLLRVKKADTRARSQNGPDAPHQERRGGTANRFDPIRQDIRLARRTLLRRPGAALGVVLLLAVGIALNTSIFGLLDAYLLESLPYPDPDRLATVRPIPPGAPRPVLETIPDGLGQVEWPTRDQVVQELVTWDLDAFTLTGGERPEVVPGAWVPPGYLRALGTVPAVGRFFTDSDGRPGAEPVVILGHDLWQERFGGDPDVIGRTISAYVSDRPFEAESFTIVGVLPADFWFTNRYTRILANLTEIRVPYMIRMTPGTSPEQAAAHLTSVVRSQLPGVDADWPGMHVASMHEMHVDRVRPVLIVLAAAAGFVLLISCGNVALLLTVRAFGRQREIGIRRALGASRLRVIQQLAAEGLLLAGAACAAGIALAWVMLRAFGPLIQEQLRTAVPGGIERLAVNLPALLVALGLSAATGLIFALVPALASTKGDLARSVREGGPASSDTPKRQATRNVVIAVEVAASLILSVGAALMLRSAIHLHRVDLGFEPDGVLTANITLRQRSYPEGGDLARFADQYLTSLRSSPNVTAVSMLAGWPFQDRRAGAVIAEREEDHPGRRAVVYVVTDGYFDTMSIPILHGRSVEPRDVMESEPVIVLSETLAMELWAGSSPIGRRVRLEAEGDDAPWRTVVGVAEDVRETLTGEILPDTYLPYAQTPSPFLFVMARTAGDPASLLTAIQGSLQAVDPTAAVTNVVTMSDLVGRGRARPRFLAVLLTAFGALAALLALTGLYSIIAYAVSQRRRDVAVHMALGAQDQTVVAMFVRKAVLVIGLGVFAGLAGSLALTRTLSSQLYGVTSLDVTAYVGTTIVMFGAAIVAAWFPARRAAATDPVTVLREE